MIEKCFKGVAKEFKIPAANSHKKIEKSFKWIQVIAEYHTNRKYKFITEVMLNEDNSCISHYILKTECSDQFILYFSDIDSPDIAFLTQNTIAEIKLLYELKGLLDKNNSILLRQKNIAEKIIDYEESVSFSNLIDLQINSMANLVNEIITSNFIATQYK
jgi:hypothetical protein